jgi:hypothetical protein
MFGENESVGFWEGLSDLDGFEDPFFVEELEGDGVGYGKSVGEFVGSSIKVKSDSA